MSGTDMWMMGLKMVAQILIGIGAVLNGLAIAGLYRDCYRGYGSTMGGEMLAGFLWTIGTLVLAAGVYFASGSSPVWALGSLGGLFLTGMLCRMAVIRLGTKYGKPQPRRRSSGFAQHVKQENALQNDERVRGEDVS